MDLQSIVGRLWPIFLGASVLILIIIGVTAFLYRSYQRKGGKINVTRGQFAAIFLILGWFIVVMVLTTFSRGANFEGWANFRLFSGYVSAWNNWSVSEWQLIIFNMLMFAPLGFLLPLVSKKMQRFMPVLLISLLVTGGVEVFQMVTRRGIFELDDLFHNTLGSVAGFLLIRGISDSVKQRRFVMKSLLKALFIPFVFLLLFSGAMLVHHSKELGNLSIRPAIPQKMDKVEITLNPELPTDAEPVSLYYSNQIRNMSYGEEVAELLKQSFDLEQKGSIRVDGFNRIWSLHHQNGYEYTLNYSVTDGGWTLLTEEVPSPMNEEELNKQGEFYEKWLLSNGLLLGETDFSIQNEGTLRWDIKQTNEDIAFGQKDFVKGIIMLVPSKDHQVPQNLHYFMSENEYVREIEIITPAQAYEEIEKGDFSIYNDVKDGDQVVIDEYKLEYTYDSKGYYQPVYYFIGTLNGEYWEASIPAVKNGA